MDMAALPADDNSGLQRVQRVLLSPLQYGDAEEWLREAAGAVQRFLGGDHAYAVRLGPESNSLILHQVDPAYKARAEAYLRESLAEGAPSTATDLPLPARMHIQRIEGGSGVYHEQDLVTREEIEQSPFFQDVAAPSGVQHATGLSAIQGASETALCVAFEEPDASGFAREASASLALLLPAFEAGLRHLRCFLSLRTRLRRFLDELSDPLFVFSTDGRELYRNRALRHLLQVVRDSRPLCQMAAGVALSVAGESSAAARVRRTLSSSTGPYVLHGTYAGPLLDAQPGVLVSVERTSPYPPPLFLQSTYDLTPREAEVALLVAQGNTDARIADILDISVHTVRRHTSAVRTKLDVSTRTQIAHRLARWDRTGPA